MISLQSSLTPLLSGAAPLAGGNDAALGSGTCVVSSATLVAAQAPSVLSQGGTLATFTTGVQPVATLKNFKNVSGHSVSPGKVDSSTR